MHQIDAGLALRMSLWELSNPLYQYADPAIQRDAWNRRAQLLLKRHLPRLKRAPQQRACTLQVLNCDKQPEGCTQDGEAESVFDLEKERLLHSLFRLLEATAGTHRMAAEAGQPLPPPPAKGPDSLAEMLARWRSNATDLAALQV